MSWVFWFVCLFFLWWARLSEVVILYADDLVCIFAFFVVYLRWPAQGATFDGWYWVLYSSGFLCVSFHSFILPKASSLVVWGLGVCAATPKAQGLISGQDQRFHKWFVMALSEIKTNIPKQETKDEPQINGSYKIRQIIIKIMEYTHIHILPWAKSKHSNKNEENRLTQQTKEIKIIFAS